MIGEEPAVYITYNVLYSVLRGVNVVFRVLQAALLLYCVLSWLPRSRFYEILYRFVEPILTPFRGISWWIMRKLGLPFNITPLLAMLALEVLQSVIVRILYWFMFA